MRGSFTAFPDEKAGALRARRPRERRRLRGFDPARRGGMKKEIINQLVTRLRAELEAILDAAGQAREYAIDGESRSESKYDTRGLESSYLAAGQAKQAEELAESLRHLMALKVRQFQPDERVETGAIVVVRRGEAEETYMILPAGGGVELVVQGLELVVVTPSSPLGRQLAGKGVGDWLALPEGGNEGEGFISELW